MSGIKLEKRDSKGVVVGFPVPDALQGLRRRVERGHAGFGYHKGPVGGIGADAEVDKHHMLSGIVQHEIRGLEILVKHPLPVDSPESLVDTGDHELPEILPGKRLPACKHLGQGRIAVIGKHHIAVVFIKGGMDYGCHAGTSDAPDLFQHLGLQGILSPEQLKDKGTGAGRNSRIRLALPGIRSGREIRGNARAKIKIGLS